MADIQKKLNLLREIAEDEETLELVLDKLFDVMLDQYRSRLARYEVDLNHFETRYHKSSSEFYREFEAGELGDAMDFFEWAGLVELQQDLIEKIERVETR